MRIAEGANYAVDLEDGVARLRVWKRPDLSYEVGAKLAEEMKGKIHGLVTDARTRGVVLDLREAPVLIGKNTRRALGELVAACEAAHRPIGVVVNEGAHRVVIEDAVRAHGPNAMRVLVDHEAAIAWAGSDYRVSR